MTAENYEASSQTESALLQQALQQVKELTQRLEQLQESHKRLEQENSNLKHRLQLRLNEQMQVEASNTPLPTATEQEHKPNHHKPTPLLIKEPSIDMVSPHTPTQLTASPGPPIQSLTPEEKITLFRKLFFSRLDV
jgi:regulator of replication initiation timing